MHAIFLHWIVPIGTRSRYIQIYCSPNEKLFPYHADDYDRSINEALKAIK